MLDRLGVFNYTEFIETTYTLTPLRRNTMLQIVISKPTSHTVNVLALPQGLLAAARQLVDYQGEDEVVALNCLCDEDDVYVLGSILDVEWYLKRDLDPIVREAIEKEAHRFIKMDLKAL